VASTPISTTFKSFSPRISVDYKFAPDSTVYALWSRGYRPGGFNTVLFTSPASVVAQFAQFGALPSYAQEKLDNFEGGIKGMFLENRARVTLAVYYDKYTNGQVSNTIPFNNPDGSLNLASAIVNTGRIDLKGVELEGELQATEELRLSGTLALNDSDIKSFLSADSTQVRGYPSVVGNQTPTAPKWTWSLSGEYTGRLTDTYKWFSRVDYQHIGRYFTDFSNVAYGNSRDMVSLRLGVRSEAISVEGFVTNLLQDKSPPSAFLGSDVYAGAAGNEIRYALPVKRQFGLRARYNF
jgi:iron complex outermembrane receptor protein